MKGLIQATVALHHLDAGNLKGALSLYQGQKKYLAPYRPRMMGLDVETFLDAMDRVFTPFLQDSSGARFDPTRAPKIDLGK